MELLRTTQLDEQQLAALDALCSKCKINDGNLVAIYRHLLSKKRPIPCNVLCYHQQQLIGFLRTFYFSDEHCEIALMVDPAYRKQGLASKMFMDIVPTILDQHTRTISFSSPNGLNQDWLSAFGYCYQGSEYQMQYQAIQTDNVSSSMPYVRPAADTDIATLVKIDTACFSEKNVDMSQRFSSLLNNPNYNLFIVEQNDAPVGKAHIHWQPHGARLTDIAVLPHAQGQGLGGALIMHCVRYALAANKPAIFLDVETNNQHALNLYLRLNFKTINAHDYWQISLLDILKHLKKAK